jgi:hypothetical protein
MTAFFKICLVALLASASVVSAMNCKEIHPDEDTITYGQKFSEGKYDSNTVFNVNSRDGTTVKSIKKLTSGKPGFNMLNIYNKKVGGPTSIALKFDLIEDGDTTSTYYRYFRVRNGTPACTVLPNKDVQEEQEEVIREASYFTVKN